MSRHKHTRRAAYLLQMDCGWNPEEDFLDILHVKEVDAASITKSLTSFVGQKNLDYRRKGMMELQPFLVVQVACKDG